MYSVLKYTILSYHIKLQVTRNNSFIFKQAPEPIRSILLQGLGPNSEKELGPNSKLSGEYLDQTNSRLPMSLTWDRKILLEGYKIIINKWTVNT